MSLLGLADYGSDHSNVEGRNGPQNVQDFAGSCELLEENANIRPGESFLKPSSPVDAPQRSSKESTPFSTPLSSPLTRLDHASQDNGSPLVVRDPPSVDSEAQADERDDHGEGEQEEDVNNHIKSEFRELFPPKVGSNGSPLAVQDLPSVNSEAKTEDREDREEGEREDADKHIESEFRELFPPEVGNGSPLAVQDPPSVDSEAKAKAREDHGEGEQGDVDNDIIKPEFRGLLPPEVIGQADPKLQLKIASLLDSSPDIIKNMKNKIDDGNPAALAQICREYEMDDKGTNFPEDRMVHPSVYDIKDFYESLMDEYRKATQPMKIKVRPIATTAAAERGIADASAPSVITTSGSTRKRVNKWGSVPPSVNALPLIGQQMKFTASSAAAVAAAVTGGRVRFSADAVAAARARHLSIPVSAQTKTTARGKEVQQQAEQLARVHRRQGETDC